MSVREFMHYPAVTCDPDTTLKDVAREMHLGNVGCVVVVEAGRTIGIVTDRDLAVRALAMGQRPTTPVAEVMTTVVVTVDADADVFDAVRKMSYAAVRRLPVVDSSGGVVGVVSLDDITEALNKEVGLMRDAVHTQLSGGPGWDMS